MLKRFKFAIEPGDESEFICHMGELDGAYICAAGLREWFDVPKRVTEFDLLVSNERLDHSYCVRFEYTQVGNLTYSPRYFYGEDCSVFFAPELDSTLSTMLREFQQLHRYCFVAVEA